MYKPCLVATGHMTYFDGCQTWDQCRRCGTIQAVRHYPDRRGSLVPLCSACAEEGAVLLRRGQPVVKLRKKHTTVEHLYLADDYEVNEY